jgi:glycosyltransferase involved in cell wall biosynthesis
MPYACPVCHPAGVRVLVVSGMRPSATDPQYGVFVARQADALRRLGAEVELVGLARSRSGGVRTVRKYAVLLGRTRLAVHRRPDVLLAHLLVPPGEIARRAARGRIPLVVAVHGQDVENARTSARLRRASERVLAAAAACVVASDDLGARLREVCAVPCPVHVIDVGVDLGTFHPGDAEVALAALGLAEPRRPLVVQAAHLEPWKDPLALAEAVERLRARTGGGELWLAGAGSLEPQLTGLPHVRLLGVVDPDAVPRLYRAADCAALVSTREGYGLAAIEAVACGTPLVVSRAVPAAADLPADAAVVVDPGDAAAIEAGIEAAVRLPRASPAGQAVAAAHGLDRQAQRLLDVLRGAAGRTPTAAARPIG